MAKRSASLGDRLVLARYILSLLGFQDFEEIQSLDLRGGFDDDAESFAFHTIKDRPDLKIPKDRLRVYDANIYEYVRRISSARGENFTLTYFQYFAILSVEIYLDRYFGNRNEFLKDLNSFSDAILPDWKISPKELERWKFTASDLGKVAVYSATGSGKTLIQHINYLQYLRYHKSKIKGQSILITPNENLSAQHVDEYRKSGIPADRLDTGSVSLGQSSLLATKESISVIEITKLKKEKKGEGASVDVASFEGDNLVFIDEAHKGITSGKEWKDLRDTVGKTGFIFEYSATFGQAVSDETFVEYAKSIVFDYSYKFFYDDGYGKDYEILNLKNQSADPSTFRLFMTGNLLSFYEQSLFYDKEPDLMREYGIERPLWVFVGQSVSKEDADVLKIVRYFRDFLEDPTSSIAHLRGILTGATGFVSSDGVDVFSQKYPYLKSIGTDVEHIYANIVSSVFRTTVGASLRFSDIKDAQGEIGLRASDGAYFGLINVGDTKKLLENIETELGRPKEIDNFHKSLFRDIDMEASPVSVLIGSKKFSEGWNSYRVSSMGLLNMGKGEGSQIIQLFGRGVRLRGKGNSLKRSSATGGSTSPYISLVETLNVFGVEADYMEKFRDYLEKEGLPEKVPMISVEFPVSQRFKPVSGLKLKTIAIKNDKKFIDEPSFSLDVKKFPSLHVELDLIAKVDAIASSGSHTSVSSYRSERKTIPVNILGYLDMERLYFEAVSYKKIKGQTNLLITPEAISELFSPEISEWYTIYAPENFPKGETFSEVRVFQDYASIVLKKYITAFYKAKREEWEKGFRELRVLEETDHSLLPKGYVIRIPTDRKDLLTAIEEARRSGGTLPEISQFQHVVFEGHLYEPLFVETPNVEYSPVALNPGEKKFVRDLAGFFSDADEQARYFTGRKLFLLRNLTKAQGGVSFFEANNFSPDFILWICEGNRQSIAFLDPKGIRQLKAFSDLKILFSNEIKKIEKELGDTDVKLHSFILSDTAFASVHWKEGKTKQDFENAGVFFQEDPDYVKKVIKRIVASFSV